MCSLAYLFSDLAMLDFAVVISVVVVVLAGVVSVVVGFADVVSVVVGFADVVSVVVGFADVVSVAEHCVVFVTTMEVMVD